MPLRWHCAHHPGRFCCQSLSSRSLVDVPIERSTRTCQSCQSGTVTGAGVDLHCSKRPRCELTAVPEWLYSHEWEPLTPISCAVLSCISVSASLSCVWHASPHFWVKRESTPHPFLGISLETVWVADPMFFSELSFSFWVQELAIEINLWMVLLFQKKLFSGLLTSLNG